jgi:hypothetical protein
MGFTLGRLVATRALAALLAASAVLKPAVPDLRSIGPLVEFLEILGVGLSTHCEIKIRDMKMKSGKAFLRLGLRPDWVFEPHATTSPLMNNIGLTRVVWEDSITIIFYRYKQAFLL